MVRLVPWDAKVVTVSDSASQGNRTDVSGPLVAELLAQHSFRVVERCVIPDGTDSIREELSRLSTGFAGLVVTTGGTGFSLRDQTPEGTALVIQRPAPGLAEAMRAINPLGRLSRGIAGTVGSCLIVNLPGSPSGAAESLSAVIDVLGHALDLLAGVQPH
jgi:molybdopterin adenylyltransferase